MYVIEHLENDSRIGNEIYNIIDQICKETTRIACFGARRVCIQLMLGLAEFVSADVGSRRVCSVDFRSRRFCGQFVLGLAEFV